MCRRIVPIISKIHGSTGQAGLAQLLISILLALHICGCSSVQTHELPPDQLQEQIAEGQLVKPGDRVSVTTIEGMTYALEITRVTEQSIEGLEDRPEDQQTVDENGDVSMQTVHRIPVEIPLEKIRAIETRELTPAGKAASATGAVVAVGGIMYFIYFLLPALLVSALVGL